ncbi:hypothetical protein [Paenibacillus periandrae]|uniref:hypothetical protein n=1 Tax=Paenibacillus periandrae TaxID=1761741 RepID=UPI001F09364D|nr:hypothetical protein [Paenibacillus periandrae]
MKTLSKAAITLVVVTYPLFLLAGFMKGTLTIWTFLLSLLLAASVIVLIYFISRIEFKIPMEKEHKTLGLTIHSDTELMFNPFKEYCRLKKLDFGTTVEEWMYMNHSYDGIYYYKNSRTRCYMLISEKGKVINERFEALKENVKKWF